VEIPPLSIPDYTPKHEAFRAIPLKQALSLIKEPCLDNDADFLKEKSLYRYAISRKLSKASLNKTTSHPIEPTLSLCRSHQNLQMSQKNS
jgi:hypothetical protein